eukprot:3363517-Alexandrium_andersonii.AAC.1
MPRARAQHVCPRSAHTRHHCVRARAHSAAVWVRTARAGAPSGRAATSARFVPAAERAGAFLRTCVPAQCISEACPHMHA